MAGQGVEEGIALYEAGHHEEALEEWRQIVEGYPYTTAWGSALFNTALDLRTRKCYREAILRFEELLGSGVDGCAFRGNLMQPYQNFHNNACLEISFCYEALGDYPSALRFALLARDKYPLKSMFGTLDYYQDLKERIDRLEQGETE